MTSRPPAEVAASSFPINWGVALCALISIFILLVTGLYAVVRDVSRETRDSMDPVKRQISAVASRGAR